MKIPMFIEVESYVVKELDDNKIQFMSGITERTSIPVGWIGPITEKTLAIEDGTKLPIVIMSVQYGKTYYIKDTYEDIKIKINNALPSGMKKESWQLDDDNDSVI